MALSTRAKRQLLVCVCVCVCVCMCVYKKRSCEWAVATRCGLSRWKISTQRPKRKFTDSFHMTSRTHIKHVGYFYTFHLTLLREHAVRNVAAGSHYSGAFLDIFPHAIFQWKALLWASINGLKRPDLQDLLRWMSSKQNWIISMFVNRPCCVYSAWWAVMGDLLSQGLDKAQVRSTWEHFWFCSQLWVRLIIQIEIKTISLRSYI